MSPPSLTDTPSHLRHLRLRYPSPASSLVANTYIIAPITIDPLHQPKVRLLYSDLCHFLITRRLVRLPVFDHLLIYFFPEEQGSKRKFEEDKLDDILEQLKAIREDKKTTISISRITQKHLTALLEELGLSRRTVEFDMASTTKRVSSFVWTDKKEDAHAEEYLTWLEGCINLPSDVNFYITSNKASLLSTTTVSSKFNINGTLDVAIVDRKYVRSRNTAGGIRVGLELKTVEESNVIQAIVELIAASIYSEYAV
ncbi:hypothetical protein BC936DRAFT_140523, partial [Jimgerdemannia flammicorona]